MPETDTVLAKFRQLPYDQYNIDTGVYDRLVKLFRFIKRFLHINFKLHDPDDWVSKGQIFVFNHFARFETLIPQYLIYESTGHYCCAIAHRELFEADEGLAQLLLSIGAIPHDTPDLMPLLATQILRGHKVIVFPEGGMVKDRRVVDTKGRYSIFSRTAAGQRKHHTGAAVLGLGLDIFKQAILEAQQSKQQEKLQRWQQQCQLPDQALLLERAAEPTIIIPANITFYPLRIDDNVIREAVDIIRPGLSKRHLEELLIEGNLLLKDTDMDIHLGEPVPVAECWNRWERWMVKSTLQDIESLDEIFTWRHGHEWKPKLLAQRIRHNAQCIRDHYMDAMYKAVTINLSHLAATLIYHCLEKKHGRITRPDFRMALYLTIKQIQKKGEFFLHRSLRNPELYGQLPDKEPPELHQFICTAEDAGLIESVEEAYYFLPKLCEEFEFDTIRLENPLAVYANEVAPLPDLKEVIADAYGQAREVSRRKLALLRFDDELQAWHWDKAFFSAPCFEPINEKETLSISGEPYLLEPATPTNRSALLIHGLLASPAVMRPLAELLAQQGYTVLAIRLKGHGTSPCDLRERSWQDWLDSVWRGYRILEGLTDKITLVGFSTGAVLALRLAADQPDCLMGIVSVAPPVKFRDPVMSLVPLVHQANILTQWMADGGLKEFTTHQSEHPETNYRHIPIRALNELRRLISETEQHLGDVHCRVLLIQSDRDPVVEPDSAEIIFDKLGTQQKTLTLIPSSKHDIVFNDPGGVHDMILFFLNQCTRPHSQLQTLTAS